MTNQPSLFDVPAAIKARDTALQRVEDATQPAWITYAEQSIAYLARARQQFTTDDVWEFMHQRGYDMPHEPRALGALMRNAMKTGQIIATDRYVPSARPECHRRPIRVWRAS